jgi:RimJ/RimL family protein N-acetyltransferase
MRLSANELALSTDRPATVATKAGQRITIRDLMPDDTGLLIGFFHQLSPGSRRQRFMSTVPDLPDELLRAEAQRLAIIDPATEAALIATAEHAGQAEAVGVVRMKRAGPADRAAEAAIVLRDDYQGQGLGTLLFDLMLRIAAEGGLEQIWIMCLAENTAMQRLVQGSGYPYTGTTSRGETTMAIRLN